MPYKTGNIYTRHCFGHTNIEFDRNRKPHSKPINFHIPFIKTLIDPMQSVTRGAYRAFAVMRDHWKRIIAAQIEQIGKTENHIGYQIRKPISDFYGLKIENQMLKNGKFAKRNEHQNRSFFGTNENPNASHIFIC